MKIPFHRVAMTAALIATGSAQAQPALSEIKVSYQPALYWALPFFVATEKNWWAELGLKPVFSTFPAGVPQIAAAASKSWDVGGTGSVPAVLGHHRHHQR
jgi:ABC-type nitrate/sulfonate/bicarbonate transport system substrate-binding protein